MANMENGGRPALLKHLLNFELSDVNLRMVPATAALLDQKIASLPPETIHPAWLAAFIVPSALFLFLGTGWRRRVVPTRRS